MSVWILFVLSALVVIALCDTKDGGKAPRIPLFDGNSIPALGLGTFLGFDENGQKEVKENEIEIPVTNAINAGYRLFDTAQDYKNEDQVGAAVWKSSVPRKDIFIVTKLASNKKRDPVAALRDSLQKMNLSYVDLYLIHNPISFTPDGRSFEIIDYVDTWMGMEETKKNGMAKSIGISNFNISQIERLYSRCEIEPSVLQVEMNLNLAQMELLDFCKKKNLVVMAYSPLGGLFTDPTVSPPPKVYDPGLSQLGNRYKKTVPQIVLRYLVQRGVVPIPKSVTKERIEENIDVFDFKLTSEEMEALGSFNKDYRTVNPSFWQEHPYYPFEKKEVPDPDPFKKLGFVN